MESTPHAHTETPPALHWRHGTWATLTCDELYGLLALRQRVFVVEQLCHYQDADGRDPVAEHVWVERDTDAGVEVLACARWFAPGVRYAEAASLGRVVSAPSVRRTGLGRELVARSLARMEERCGPSPVRISAQKYLEAFYGSFGFVTQGEPYLEDAIVHVAMVRPAGSAPPVPR